ncbi:fungal-specific transcription factor domain-containing protein [Aspergillus varians]
MVDSPSSTSRRRAKPQLSCNLCRRRKLKCDREYPCGTCSKRGLDKSCIYPPNAMQPSSPGRPSASVQARIQQLENLVISLRQTSKGSTDIPSITPSQDMTEIDTDGVSTQSDYGSMKVNDSGTASYVNADHWLSVLDGISELKDYFETEESQQVFDPPYSGTTGPLLLFGCPQYATKEDILASMPERFEVDRLVSCYFNSFDMSPAVLHRVEFLKEYEAFWKCPAETSIIWLGLLFTIMCLAAQFQRSKFDSGLQPMVSTKRDPQTMVEVFRAKIVQCLILGKYHKGGPYVLETLMLYFTCEHFLCNDAEIGIWLLLGIIVQLAMHMGFHRNPEHFQNQEMSPFTGEMRRRVWATIMDLDLGISAQMGLPRLIKPWQADTEEPHNYLDTDFDRHTTKLPRSRPDTETTPMLYRLAKSRMMSTLGLILDLGSDTRQHTFTYSDVVKMDSKLHETHDSIPECLKWRSMAHCITDSSQIIMQKLFLDVLFHKAKIVLHRKFLIRPQDQYEYSHKECLDAALQILEYQHILDEETQPFCQLYQERWRVSSLVNHDFLLAASVICSYLQQNSARRGEANTGLTERIYAVLKRSYDIWMRSSSSREARKATRALAVVLRNRHAIPPLANDETMSEASPSVYPPGEAFMHSSGMRSYPPRDC